MLVKAPNFSLLKLKFSNKFTSLKLKIIVYYHYQHDHVHNYTKSKVNGKETFDGPIV